MKSIKLLQIPVIFLLLIKSVINVEETEREIFLKPRNFNPHPYEAGVEKNNKKSGPVLFPPNPEDEQNNDENVISIGGNLNNDARSHPVDRHPYAKVARKRKYKLAGRFSNADNKIDPKVYQALANHARRVLTQSPQDLKKNHIRTAVYDDSQKDYAFSYKVVDDITGDDFSHKQSQNAKATNGEYRVKLPDGRVQIVSYTADKNGYKADVKYTSDDSINSVYQDDIHQQSSVQIERVPVRELKPAPPKNYFVENIPLQPFVYLAPTPNPDYNNYGPTPRSFVLPYRNPQPKVQIYTTNARDYMIGSYIPNTVSSIPVKTIHDYKKVGEVSSTIAPLIFNSGTHGLVSPTPSPTSLVLTDRHGNIVADVVATTVAPIVINNGNHGHIAPSTLAPHGFRHDYGEFVITTVAPPTIAHSHFGNYHHQQNFKK